MANKKTEQKCCTDKKVMESVDKIKNELHSVAGEVAKLAKQAKDKYDSMDTKTKKQVVAGLAGAAALLAGAIGIAAAKKRK